MRVDPAPASGWRKWPTRLTECVCIALSLAAQHTQAQECPIAITQPPQSLTVLENCQATFDVGVTGAAPVFLQWLRDDLPIAGATNSSYILEFAHLADNGSVFRVVVTNSLCSVTSAPAVLNISLDVVPPRLAVANGGPTLNTVAVFFVGSCGLVGGIDPVSGTDPYNYSLSGGLVVSNAVLAPGGTNVILTTSPQTPGAEYTLYVENVRDLSGNSVPMGSHVTFRARTPIRLSIQRVGTNCVISWEPPVGILETTDDWIEGWTQIPSATSPYSVPAVAKHRFYRAFEP